MRLRRTGAQVPHGRGGQDPRPLPSACHGRSHPESGGSTPGWRAANNPSPPPPPPESGGSIPQGGGAPRIARNPPAADAGEARPAAAVARQVRQALGGDRRLWPCAEARDPRHQARAAPRVLRGLLSHPSPQPLYEIIDAAIRLPPGSAECSTRAPRARAPGRCACLRARRSSSLSWVAGPLRVLKGRPASAGPARRPRGAEREGAGCAFCGDDSAPGAVAPEAQADLHAGPRPVRLAPRFVLHE